MKLSTTMKSLLEYPVVPTSITSDSFYESLNTPAKAVFCQQGTTLATVSQQISEAHNAGKSIFLCIDLIDGLGKDRDGVEYLADCGADGVITTRGQLIRYGKQVGLLTVQKFFVLDSLSLSDTRDIIAVTRPDSIMIAPGVVGKVIEKFSRFSTPVIAGGLIEIKNEVEEALRYGAAAITTSCPALWHL